MAQHEGHVLLVIVAHIVVRHADWAVPNGRVGTGTPPLLRETLTGAESEQREAAQLPVMSPLLELGNRRDQTAS